MKKKKKNRRKNLSKLFTGSVTCNKINISYLQTTT